MFHNTWTQKLLNILAQKKMNKNSSHESISESLHLKENTDFIQNLTLLLM